MTEIELSKKEIIVEIGTLRDKVKALGQEKSSLLKIAQESFILGSASHLNSLNPEIREQLGLELAYLTQHNVKLEANYTYKKNKYLSLGKSYAAISFLFDLVDDSFTLLDLILLQEILMNDGNFRKNDVFIIHPNGQKLIFNHKNIFIELEYVLEFVKIVIK